MFLIFWIYCGSFSQSTVRRTMTEIEWQLPADNAISEHQPVSDHAIAKLRSNRLRMKLETPNIKCSVT